MYKLYQIYFKFRLGKIFLEAWTKEIFGVRVFPIGCVLQTI